MTMSQDSRAPTPGSPGSTVDPAEIAKFSRLAAEWWDPKGKMAPLHKINPLRLPAQGRWNHGGLDLEPQLEELRARHRRRRICAALAAAGHPSMEQVCHPGRTGPPPDE